MFIWVLVTTDFMPHIGEIHFSGMRSIGALIIGGIHITWHMIHSFIIHIMDSGSETESTTDMVYIIIGICMANTFPVTIE